MANLHSTWVTEWYSQLNPIYSRDVCILSQELLELSAHKPYQEIVWKIPLTPPQSSHLFFTCVQQPLCVCLSFSRYHCGEWPFTHSEVSFLFFSMFLWQLRGRKRICASDVFSAAFGRDCSIMWSLSRTRTPSFLLALFVITPYQGIEYKIACVCVCYTVQYVPVHLSQHVAYSYRTTWVTSSGMFQPKLLGNLTFDSA